MRRARQAYLWVLSVSAALLLPSPLASAASHLWRVNEVFSNATGSVQFVELKESMGSTGEYFMTGKTVTSTTKVFTFPGDLVPPTDHKHLLLATAAFAALPGAPTPDYILQPNFFAMNGDTLKYAPQQNYDTYTFGAGVLPTNGIDSIQITNYTTHTFTTGPNSPTNYAGQSGSVNAAPCIDNDSDGYGSPGNGACPNGSATDCNDNNSAIHPGAVELCADSADNDCNGLQDCADPACAGVFPCPCLDTDSDGYGSPGNSLCPNGAAADCNNSNSAIHPGATELCTDGADNDCNGLQDCDDPVCADVVPCIPTLSGGGLLVAAVLLVVAGQVVITRRRRMAGL